MTSTDPGTILTLANQRLCEDLDLDLAASYFVTLFFGRLDPHTGSLTYAGAGHNPGYVLSSEGQIKTTLTSKGLPLGGRLGRRISTAACCAIGGRRSTLPVHRRDRGGGIKGDR